MEIKKHPIEMGKLEIEQYLIRNHVHPQTLGRNIKVASQKANLNKRVTSHIFRHSYAIHSFLINT